MYDDTFILQFELWDCSTTENVTVTFPFSRREEIYYIWKV